MTARILKLCANERSKSWKSATLQNFNVTRSTDDFSEQNMYNILHLKKGTGNVGGLKPGQIMNFQPVLDNHMKEKSIEI